MDCRSILKLFARRQQFCNLCVAEEIPSKKRKTACEDEVVDKVTVGGSCTEQEPVNKQQQQQQQSSSSEQEKTTEGTETVNKNEECKPSCSQEQTNEQTDVPLSSKSDGWLNILETTITNLIAIINKNV